VTAGSIAKTRSWALFGAALFAAGCTPLVPFHLAETAESLPPRQVSLGGAAAVGSARHGDNAVGGALRARVGVGHRQEVGVETAAAATLNPNPAWTFGGKLAWKISPRDWLAFVAGANVSVQQGWAVAMGPDAAVILSSAPLTVVGRARVYGGLRLGVMFPSVHDVYADNGLTAVAVAPVGLAVEIGRSTRVFVEGGFAGASSFNHATPFTYRPTEVYAHRFYGGYAVLAFSVSLPLRCRP
jgi:hypothetical protein